MWLVVVHAPPCSVVVETLCCHCMEEVDICITLLDGVKLGALPLVCGMEKDGGSKSSDNACILYHLFHII
jgi:hypothetical protein